MRARVEACVCVHPSIHISTLKHYFVFIPCFSIINSLQYRHLIEIIISYSNFISLLQLSPLSAPLVFPPLPPFYPLIQPFYVDSSAANKRISLYIPLYIFSGYTSPRRRPILPSSNGLQIRKLTLRPSTQGLILRIFLFSYKFINIIWLCSNLLAMSNSYYNPVIYALLNIIIFPNLPDLCLFRGLINRSIIFISKRYRIRMFGFLVSRP